MNTGGESAELLMKMMLNGSEVLIRLTGSGAKNVAVLLYSVLREQNKTKGSERLSNMLRSGKKLRVYTFQEKDLPKFKEVAKQYGILYTVLKDFQGFCVKFADYAFGYLRDAFALLN